MKLFRNGLTISCIDGLVKSSGPSEGSVNVPLTVEFDEDDEYFDYTQQVHVRYVKDNQSVVAILPFADDQYTLTSPIFAEDGPLQIAVHLIKGDVCYVTNELNFVKNKAPNGTTEVDPSQYSWQQLVDEYMETKLASLKTQVNTNKSNIATNTSNIATNTSNIATNTSNIATNKSNIAKNVTSIATNKTGIVAINQALANVLDYAQGYFSVSSGINPKEAPSCDSEATYVCTVWYRQNGNGNAYFELREQDSSNAILKRYAPISVQTTDWTKMSVEFTTQSTTVKLMLALFRADFTAIKLTKKGSNVNLVKNGYGEYLDNTNFSGATFVQEPVYTTTFSDILSGNTVVVVEDATATASAQSDEASSDNAVATVGLEEPTMGDEYNTSTSTSESQSESESTSTSESEVEVEEVTSESIVVEPQQKEELS